MRKHRRQIIRILIAALIPAVSLIVCLSVRTLRVIRWRTIDQTLPMRCLGACPDEFLKLHLQGEVTQFNEFNGRLTGDEIEIELNLVPLMPRTWDPEHEYRLRIFYDQPWGADLACVYNLPLTQWFVFDSARSFLILPADFELSRLRQVEQAAQIRLAPYDSTPPSDPN